MKKALIIFCAMIAILSFSFLTNGLINTDEIGNFTSKNGSEFDNNSAEYLAKIEVKDRIEDLESK